jgi:xyloglucan-specific exo-beta-1,4-glucanase
LTSSASGKGNLWLAASDGLYRTLGGSAFARIAGIDAAWAFAEGAAAAGSTQPAWYLDGQINGVAGLFQSLDAGATWKRIDDPAHEYGVINILVADPNIFGRVYLGTASRGIIYGDVAP